MDELSGIPWPALSVATAGWSLAVFFMALVYRGRLIPKSTHDEVIHDRNEWRAESRIKDAQISEKDKQLGHLAEVGETQKALLQSIRRVAGQEPT